MSGASRAHEAQSLVETRAGAGAVGVPHPALALLRCGAVAEALAVLRERDDAPAAQALLEAGFVDYAETVLQRHRAGALEGRRDVPRCAAPEKALTGLETQETGQSVDVRRRA